MRWTRAKLRALADARGDLPGHVRIYPDGTLLRTDVRADLAHPLTVAEAVKLAGLDSRQPEKKAN